MTLALLDSNYMENYNDEKKWHGLQGYFTGHCNLNKYLHRFNIIETSECECGVEMEIVDHYL